MPMDLGSPYSPKLEDEDTTPARMEEVWPGTLKRNLLPIS